MQSHVNIEPLVTTVCLDDFEEAIITTGAYGGIQVAKPERQAKVIKDEIDDIYVKLEPLITAELDIKDVKMKSSSLFEGTENQQRRSEPPDKEPCVKRCYKCKLCEFKAPSKLSIEQHIRAHLKRPFKCKTCLNRFECEKSLEMHMRMHSTTPDNLQFLMCKQCDYKTISQRQLVNHMRAHNGEKLFKCEVCDYESSTEYALQIHIKAHIEQKSFKCRICHYTFSQRTLLRRHMESYQR